MKNIRYFKTIFLLAFASLLFSGCKKFLDEKSQDELVPSTVTHLRELLSKEGYPNQDQSFHWYLSLLDDDVKSAPPPLSTNRDQLIVAKGFYSWSADAFNYAKSNAGTAGSYTEDGSASSGGFNAYRRYYNRIMGCNVVLDKLPEVTGSQDEKDQLEGETLTLRAYYYFMLVNLYAWPYNASGHSPETSLGVPIILTSVVEETPIPRASVYLVYELIKKDIEKAITLLEKPKTQVVSTLYRVSKEVAWLMASRVYLHMEDWEKSKEYAEKLMSSKGTLLNLNNVKTPDLSMALGNFMITGPANPEVLMLYCKPNADSRCVGFTVQQGFAASDDLYNLYAPYTLGVSNDLRGQLYLNIKNLVGVSHRRGIKTFVDSKFDKAFRVAEGYLNNAESCIRLYLKNGSSENNLLTTALTNLNDLRRNRYKINTYLDKSMADFSNDANQLLAFCLEERRREFCFEEFRWFDLRRNGMPELKHDYRLISTNPVETFTLPAGSPRYVLRIPDPAMDANTALVQNE